MHRARNITFFLVAIVSALATSQAHAVQRTHVSAAIGDDINTAANCTPVAPCRTFQAAMTVTDVNGEVVVLDSGDYGIVTITQSVALIAPKGVYGGISVSHEDLVGVFSNTPGINVVLRGLLINGLSTNGQGGGGIQMRADGKLTVENCVISNFTNGTGIIAGPVVVRVTNTIIRDNGNGIDLNEGAHGTITRSTISGNANAGVLVQGSAGADGITTLDIADSTIDGNGDGVNAISFNANTMAKVSIRDSRIVRNVNFGLAAQSGKNNNAVRMSASNNIVSNNGVDGIVANGAGTMIWVSGNTISDNRLFGFGNFDGAIFKTAGNNAVRNNGTDTSGLIENVGTR